MGHSDSEKLSKHKSELPKSTTFPFFGSTLKSVHQKDKKTMTSCFSATLTNMFISVVIMDKSCPDTPLEFAAMGYYGIALHKQFLKTVIPSRALTVRRMKFLLHWEGLLMRKIMPKNWTGFHCSRRTLEPFFLTLETLFCTKKAARRLAESQRFTAKLWNKGLAIMRLIRSNEPPVAIS